MKWSQLTTPSSKPAAIAWGAAVASLPFWLFVWLVFGFPTPALSHDRRPGGALPRAASQPISVTLQTAPAIDYNPVIAGMIGQVTSSTLYTLVGSLSGEWPVTIGGEVHTLTSRHTDRLYAITLATQYTYEYFDQLGLAVDYDYFYYARDGGLRRNVVAQQTGLTQPDRIYFLTAHLDNQPFDFIAPGADDNASGSAGVMAAAEVLRNYRFGCTIRYVLFTGEEQGMLGSDAYVEAAAIRDDNIDGAINLDMIGYRVSSWEMELYTWENRAPGSNAIATLFRDVNHVYSLGLSPVIYDVTRVSRGLFSDNASFWYANSYGSGYPAILAIEDTFPTMNPNYHSNRDRLSTLDMSYYTAIVRSALGTLAHQGCLLDTPAVVIGEVLEANTGNPVPQARVEAQADRPGLGFNAAADPSAYYQLDLISATYTLTAAAPGYVPVTVSGLPVPSGEAVRLDFTLCAPVMGVDFRVNPPYPAPGEVLTFTARLEKGTPPISYIWNFGDGLSALGGVVTHTFPITETTSAVFPVTLTAANDCDFARSITKAVIFDPHLAFLPMVWMNDPE